MYIVPGKDKLAAILVMWPERDHLLVENIAVEPADQGRGLGRQLMHCVDQHAWSLRLAAVELYTNAVMTENLAFYARLGFVEVARRRDAGYQRVFMRKYLASPPSMNVLA